VTALPLWLQQLLDDNPDDEILQRLGEWLLDLFGTMRQGIIVLDVQGTILAFNQFLRERYGWTNDGDLGTNVFAARPLLVEQGIPERFQAVLQTGEPLELLAVRNITRQGQEVYQNYWAYPWVIDGRTLGVVVLVEDVTETVHMAQELARIKDYLDDIVNSTNDAILVLDDRGCISFANDVAQHYAGCPAQELIGRRAMAFIQPAQRRIIAAAGRKLVETGEPGYLETQLCLNDGRCLDVGLTYARLRERPGTIVILRDISDRKRLEHDLRTRNRELSALSTIASTVSHTLDLEELLRLALVTTLDLVSADIGTIFLRDERGDGHELQPGPQVGLEEADARSICQDPQWAREVLETGQPLFIDGADVEQVVALAGFRSLAFVPLIAHGEVRGVLMLACRQTHICDGEIRSLLLAIGQQIGVAVENARLFARTQHQLQNMNRLFAVSQVLTSTLDRQRVLELVLDAATQAIPAAERGAVALLDRDRDELVIGAARGYDPSAIRECRFPANQGYDGWALQHRQPIQVDDVAADPRARLTSHCDIGSAIAVPLIARDEPIGVLDLANTTRTAAFTEADLHLLATFANQAAVAIENARLFDESQRRVAELSTLTQIGRAISTALDLDELLELIYQQTSRVMDTTNFFIALYDQETDTVQFPLAVEGGARVESRPDFAPRRAGHALTEHVIQTRAPLLLHRAVAQCMKDVGIEQIGPPALSWLGVPLMIGARVLGVIAVQSYEREEAYTVEHLILLSTLAAQAAVAIENARLYAQARRAEELAALNRISTLVTSSLDPQQVLDTIVAATVRVMHCQKAAIFIRDEHQDVVHLMSAHGLSERYVRESQNIPLAAGRVAAVRQGRVFAVEDPHTHPNTASIQDLAQEGVRASLDVPLRGRDRVLGCLTAYYDAPHRFSQEEIELLTTFANQAAVAIENARLYASTDERLRERVTELVTLQQVSLRLTASLEPSRVLDTIAEAALRLVEASDIHIFLYDQETGQFTFGAGLWDTGERNRIAGRPRQDGITARTAREGRPIVINDAEHHPLYNTPEARAWGMKAIASFPLKRADRVVGVFNVAFLYPHRFSEDELRILGLLADQAAIAIENARLYEEAQRLSITDGLTGLYNSRHFYAVLKREMARNDRYDHVLSLVMMDIDNFKAYNDAHGHLAGDDLLQELARLLLVQIRESDMAFRYGGEEFALLLPETDKTAAARLAERIRDLMTAHEFTIKETGASSYITVSMGVAMYPTDATDEREFVHAADMALYAAKAAGKNRVRVCDFPWSDPVD